MVHGSFYMSLECLYKERKFGHYLTLKAASEESCEREEGHPIAIILSNSKRMVSVWFTSVNLIWCRFAAFQYLAQSKGNTHRERDYKMRGRT